MPKYFDLRGIPKILAVFAVSSLLTIAAGANLRFAEGVANAALFLDGSKNASSTSRVLVDGNAGTVTSTRFHTNGTTLTDGYNIRITGLNGTYGTDGTNLALGTQTADSIRFYTANVSRWDINSSGNIIPSLTDGTQDIGSQSARVGGIYAVSVSSTSYSAGAGAVGTPSINFAGAGEATTGFYIDAGGRMAVAVDGALEATWYTTHFELNDDILPGSSNVLDLGSSTRLWRSGWFGGTVTSTHLDINLGTTATTTMKLGDADTPGCIIIGDNDRGGVTYLTALNGTIIGSTTDCR